MTAANGHGASIVTRKEDRGPRPAADRAPLDVLRCFDQQLREGLEHGLEYDAAKTKSRGHLHGATNQALRHLDADQRAVGAARRRSEECSGCEPRLPMRCGIHPNPSVAMLSAKRRPTLVGP